jgi:predicted dithiol-disulfide oxidoreductase (DUF899 family)
MSELVYPNESQAYRDARAALLKDEQELVAKTKALAEKRRRLPPGGQLKEDYTFQWASGGKAGERLGERVTSSALFGGKDTLILYSFMFGPNWDKPCPSCTSLMDGFDRAWYSVAQDAAFAAIAKAPAERIDAWAKERGWSQIPLLSGAQSSFQADYKCQGENDDMQLFWSTEGCRTMSTRCGRTGSFTPDGRPDRPTPPQRFRSEFLEKNYLNKEGADD